MEAPRQEYRYAQEHGWLRGPEFLPVTPCKGGSAVAMHWVWCGKNRYPLPSHASTHPPTSPAFEMTSARAWKITHSILTCSQSPQLLCCLDNWLWGKLGCCYTMEKGGLCLELSGLFFLEGGACTPFCLVFLSNVFIDRKLRQFNKDKTTKDSCT